MDIMIPKINGIEVCRRLRFKKDTPIIMLTAKGDITNKVNGLDTGADDYLTKPFEIEELLARIRVILRRAENKQNQEKIIQVADLKLDLEKKQVSRNGKNIELTKKEYEILEESKIIETNKNIYSSSNEVCYIEADISNIKELIRIFIDNAIKYTNDTGEIDIFSKKENGKIYINIKDNGVGIKLESELGKGSTFTLIFKETI